ncbi:MAG: replicative DNA helicase [Bacteroidales bacterium]|nr:replicative DNA helicase [Bacteroidales bacterium]
MAKQTKYQPEQQLRIEDYDGHKPPQAIDIEEAVLGAMLLEADVIPDLLVELKPECFYKEQNRLVFKAIASLAAKNAPVDILSVDDELKREGKEEEAGGAAYLSHLSTKLGSAAHVDYHSKVLLQKYIQRAMITMAYRVLKEAFEGSMPVADLLDSAQDELFKLSENGMRSNVVHIRSALSQTLDTIESNQEREDGLSGLPSGYVGIDRMTFGWQPGDMVILAARPSVGKTAFALTMARNMAVDHHIPVAFFSTEMSQVQLASRLLTAETGLPADKLRGGKKMNRQDWARVNDAIARLEKAPFFIDSTGSISVYEFRAKARRLVTRENVKVLIVDYLQHMTGPAGMDNRVQEVAAISRVLKDVAIELNVPVIALSQLSRDVEKRGGSRRPQLSDLRDSGSIEQDADIVMFIHRPETMGLQDECSFPGETDLIIAKHRNGETGDVKMRFLASEMRYVDYSDPVYVAPERASYTQSRMNDFSDES